MGRAGRRLFGDGEYVGLGEGSVVNGPGAPVFALMRPKSPAA
jgi:hypothetical protein